ncbi:MAG: hypothetical protein ACI9EM_000379 [Candidatus Thalassarchaeaceae archaeon]|jgi:hypothetical protein|tara:strand:+ start:3381 stop:4511 length:1131 start_codon:yes stop_codon:yes gene_type:complete
MSPIGDVSRMVAGRKLLSRFHLALIMICQVTVVPTALFAIAYLIDLDISNSSVGIRTEMLQWVIIAGITYGIISLALALIMGSFTPLYVSNRGGWITLLLFNQRINDPELIDRARLSAYSSPYGKMSRLVFLKMKNDNYDIMAIHGGLQLLAVPMQVILIAIPLIIMEGMPDSIIKPDSAFQLGMIGYLIALWASIRLHPIISEKLIGLAYIFRIFLGKLGRVSSALPLLLYWLFARFVLKISLGWLGINYEQWHEIQLEQMIIQTIAPAATIPDTAILDYIVAISVLPMATFTTISVLSGYRNIPDWMIGQEENLENLRSKSLVENNENGIFSEYDKNEIENSIKLLDKNDVDKVGKEDSDRMVDSPFNLFSDQR